MYKKYKKITRNIAQLFVMSSLSLWTLQAGAVDARSLIKAAIDAWRGSSSDSTITMTIHRPEWERSMTMRGWTKGNKKSIVRIVAPKKDAGNGTLLLDNNMWTYTPKINRIIKIPSSMMSQSWMGSDFSNKDISRSDDIIDEYDHRLLGEKQQDGHKVYVVESIPHEDAAVVWGKEITTIRDDYVVMAQEFYDQEGLKIKQLITRKTGVMDKRPIAIVQRMEKLDKTDEWTEIEVLKADYDLKLNDQLFTLSNLRNPR